MRIATWNVNSLKARQEAVERWLERAAPDILLMQETKLTDADAPVMAFAMAGYQLVHHGEGRWNGVAIAARQGATIGDVVTNFGDGPVRDSGPGGAGAEAIGEDDFDPFDEARMVAATVDGIRVVSLYAPNGRVVGSPFYDGKLAWFERLARWVRETTTPDDAAGPRRRPQRRADRRRRLGRRGRPWRHARVGAGACGVPGPARRSGSTDALSRAARRDGTVLVVGLPGRDVPQEPRDAHRPPAASRRRWPAGSSTPRSTARPARGRPSRPTTPRCSSTSTNRAARSTPTGTARWRGSPRGPARPADPDTVPGPGHPTISIVRSFRTCGTIPTSRSGAVRSPSRCDVLRCAADAWPGGATAHDVDRQVVPIMRNYPGESVGARSPSHCGALRCAADAWPGDATAHDVDRQVVPIMRNHPAAVPCRVRGSSRRLSRVDSGRVMPRRVPAAPRSSRAAFQPRRVPAAPRSSRAAFQPGRSACLETSREGHRGRCLPRMDARRAQARSA